MALHSDLWRSRNPYGQRLWHDGWKVGRWRELSELAVLVPGLRGAILDHVALHGKQRIGGSIEMYRSAKEMGIV